MLITIEDLLIDDKAKNNGVREKTNNNKNELRDISNAIIIYRVVLRSGVDLWLGPGLWSVNGRPDCPIKIAYFFIVRRGRTKQKHWLNSHTHWLVHHGQINTASRCLLIPF
jgi:hypothetical protein